MYFCVKNPISFSPSLLLSLSLVFVCILLILHRHCEKWFRIGERKKNMKNKFKTESYRSTKQESGRWRGRQREKAKRIENIKWTSTDGKHNWKIPKPIRFNTNPGAFHGANEFFVWSAFSLLNSSKLDSPLSANTNISNSNNSKTLILPTRTECYVLQWRRRLWWRWQRRRRRRWKNARNRRQYEWHLKCVCWALNKQSVEQATTCKCVPQHFLIFVAIDVDINVADGCCTNFLFLSHAYMRQRRKNIFYIYLHAFGMLILHT